MSTKTKPAPAEPGLTPVGSPIEWLVPRTIGGTGPTIVELTQDDTKDLVFTVLAPTTNGQYEATVTPTRRPADNLGWLVVDRTGNGPIEIAQVTKNASDQLGLTVWTPSGYGYELEWSDADLGQPAANSVGFLAVHMLDNDVNQIVQLWTDRSLGYRVYIPDKAGGYEFKDEGTLAEEWPAEPLGFVLVDPHGDGRSSIAQFWAAKGNLVAYALYSPDGYTYSQSDFSADFARSQKETITWLAVDAGGGKDSLVQLITLDNGNLGLAPYRMESTGHYVPTWSPKDMGLPAAAIAFLTVRLPGEDREHILQLWSSDGLIGGALYYGRADGSFALAWYRENLGSAAETELAMLAVDPSQSGFDDCARLWSLNGNLSMEMYSPAGYSPGWSGTP
jgi:hypothetical protein